MLLLLSLLLLQLPIIFNCLFPFVLFYFRITYSDCNVQEKLHVLERVRKQVNMNTSVTIVVVVFSQVYLSSSDGLPRIDD